MQNPDAFKVAAVRGVLAGIVLGASAALAVYATTDAFKPIFVAGMSMFFSTIVVRLGFEGTYDATKAAPAKGESAISTSPPLG